MKTQLIIKTLFLLVCLLGPSWMMIPPTQAAPLSNPVPCGTDGLGTSTALRAAIAAANQPGGPAEIELSPNCVYLLDHQVAHSSADGVTHLPYLTRNLTIIGNGATLQRRSTAPAYRILLIEAGVAVTMTNLTFENGLERASGFGGAIRLKPNARLTLENVNFKNNTASIGGGAISVAPGHLEVTGGLFENNRARERGGGAIGVVGTTVIANAKFIDNQAIFGGALLLSGVVKLDHNEFLKNKALAGNGGAVYIGFIGNDAFLTRNKFFENQATDTGGGAFIEDPRSGLPPSLGHVHVYNNLWVNQIAPDTAHLYLRVVGNVVPCERGQCEKSFSVHYNTFVGSQSPTDESTGVSLREDRSNQATALPALVFNNIFVGHDVALENGGDLQLAIKTNLFFNNRVNFQGNFADPLSLFADPLFVDPTNGDFHLSQNSPAVSRATDKGIGLDLDGVARPQGEGFDIGAYEFTARNPQDGPGPAPDPDPNPDPNPNPNPGGFSVFLPLVVK